MTPAVAPLLSEPQALLCGLFLILIPCAAAGLALINTGLGRSRSAAHMMLSSLCAASLAALVYFAWGFGVQGFAGGPARIFTVAGKEWSWIGAGPFFLHGVPVQAGPVFLVALFGMFGAGLAALIPLGSGGDRWRLGAVCISTVLLAGLTYPLFAHWAWGGGWLEQLGPNRGLGRGFLDTGGSGAIQAVGGLTALATAWILGPRRGKYTLDGMPVAIPGHNAVLVLLGCSLSLIGWLGLNSAATMLFAGSGPARVPAVAVNTMLAAAASGLAAAVITHSRYGKPDASLTANGWIGGLAASSAGCAFVRPAAAVVIGAIAGVVVTLAVEWFELRLSVDDPGGSISAHGVGGIWGLLAVGLFAGGGAGQLLAQLVGIATLLGFILPVAYGANWLVNKFYPQRVSAEGERQGMDLYELGAGAYPEFLVHSDEFTQRKI